MENAQAQGTARSGLTFGGNLRAAVFGMSDGLVSNTSLILGVAGALTEPRTILITGAAGLLAGALSMAAGEYVSVASQRELFERQIERERRELRTNPREEIDQLAAVYRHRGLSLELACRISRAISSNPDTALQTHAREVLGLNPEDLGSPGGAAASSFVSFAIGAVLPLIPFLLHAGDRAVAISAALAGVALFGVGMVSSRLTEQPMLRGGLRTLLIGGGAGVIAYVIGRILGVTF